MIWKIKSQVAWKQECFLSPKTKKIFVLWKTCYCTSLKKYALKPSFYQRNFVKYISRLVFLKLLKPDFRTYLYKIRLRPPRTNTCAEPAPMVFEQVVTDDFWFCRQAFGFFIIFSERGYLKSFFGFRPLVVTLNVANSLHWSGLYWLLYSNSSSTELSGHSSLQDRRGFDPQWN